MMSRMEIVLYLKRLEFFSHLHGDNLARLARITREKHFRPADVIIAEGNIGDSLFIVVSGKVRVHRFNTTISELGAFESFGEMSLLDSEPRNATVTAVNDVVCLQICREQFYDLMHGHMDIAMGVIRILTRRLQGSHLRS